MKLLWKTRRSLPTLLSVFFLCGVITYLHWPGIRPGYTFLPVDLANNLLPWRSGAKVPLQNFLISDPLYQYYPFFYREIENWRTGQSLLWTPLIYLGHPAYADPLFQTFYPVFLFFGLWWGAERGYGLALYAHALLAVLAMYGFLRTLRVSTAAACLGALTYAASGYLITWFEFAFWTSTLAWLPVVLWCYRLALLKRQPLFTALAGLALGVALLAGQFQFVLLFVIGVGLCTLLMLGRQARQKKPQVRATLSALGLMCVIGFAISAMQALPFIELLAHSRRLLTQGLVEPLPVRQLATLLLPNFYGNPTWGLYWGASNYNEFTLYAGLVTWQIALAAVFSRPRFWPVSLVALMLLLLYWSVGGPGVTWLGIVPVIKYISLHRSLFVVPLLLGVLVALALDTKLTWWAIAAATLILVGLIWLPFQFNWGDAAVHLDLLGSEIKQAILLLGIGLAVLLAKAISPELAPLLNWGLVVLVVFDLFSFGRHYNPTGKVKKLLPENPPVQVLQAQKPGGRVVALQRGNEILFPPNVFMKFGLAQPGGYSSLMSPALHELISTDDPKIEWRWFKRGGNFVPFSYPSSRLLDLLSVRYLASPEILFDPGPEAEIVQSACTGKTATIRTGAPLGGYFTVRHTAINRLDLSFRLESRAPITGQILLQMWREEKPPVLMMEKTFTTTALLQQPAQVVYFAPEQDAPGQTYRWQLASSTPEDTGVALCTDDAGAPALSLYGTKLHELYHDEHVYLYERFAPFPRAYVVYASRVLPNEPALLPLLLNEQFDLRNIAVSTRNFGLPATSPLAATAAQIVAESNTQLIIHANAQAPGLLVLSDLYYPGWQASVDDQPTVIEPVNYVLRGVALAPGEHTVVFAYRPRSLIIGWLCGGFGILLAGLVCLQSIKRRPH